MGSYHKRVLYKCPITLLYILVSGNTLAQTTETEDSMQADLQLHKLGTILLKAISVCMYVYLPPYWTKCGLDMTLVF